ncbi:hypothetical protein SAMN05421788_107160 [Filimonas lacunae]|uniref:Uncharacterized protein n=1 Tax=Filimonas lacunae TaxID=477680 RepID=A0A1N7QWE0_9BACT|nr:hypothetical protein SAMN05421788_107160 [Filimonas lacunae]
MAQRLHIIANRVDVGMKNKKDRIEKKASGSKTSYSSAHLNSEKPHISNSQ